MTPRAHMGEHSRVLLCGCPGVSAGAPSQAVRVTPAAPPPPRIDPERLEPTADELSNLAWLVWYARKRRGKAEDVARAAWMENPYLRADEGSAT